MKLSILVGESTSWPSFFCTSKDYTQLLIMRACMWNGNCTTGMNNAMASKRGGMERKRHRFLTATVHVLANCPTIIKISVNTHV